MQALLQEEDKLNEIVQLVGSDALPARQQLILEVTRMIREFFLQQNAFHEVDTFCDLRKMSMMMETILHYYHQAGKALDNGVPLGKLLDIEAKNMIATVKFEKDYGKILKKAREDIDEAIDTAFNSVKEATA